LGISKIAETHTDQPKAPLLPEIHSLSELEGDVQLIHHTKKADGPASGRA
jgi:hypothetical protein